MFVTRFEASHAVPILNNTLINNKEKKQILKNIKYISEQLC